MSVAASAVVVSLAFAHVTFAGEEVTQSSIGLSDAVAAFSHRSPTDPAPIEQTLAILGALENKSDDADVNYDVFILKARALYWKGVHAANNKDKLAIHEAGQNAAEEAKKINDGYAEAFYFAGINLARWGEANGVITSLFKKDQLMRYMNDAMNRPTRDGQAGESVDGYGPDRTLGRVYFKLPAMFGGSHSQSVNYLKKAIEDKTYPVALSTVYYAETLNDGSTAEKAQAKQLLDALLSQDPLSINPARVPENLEEFEEAKQLRAKMH
jgi:hypothetical protein